MFEATDHLLGALFVLYGMLGAPSTRWLLHYLLALRMHYNLLENLFEGIYTALRPYYSPNLREQMTVGTLTF